MAWGPNVSAGDPIQPETRREVLMDTYHGHTGGRHPGAGPACARSLPICIEARGAEQQARRPLLQQAAEWGWADS